MAWAFGVKAFENFWYWGVPVLGRKLLKNAVGFEGACFCPADWDVDLNSSPNKPEPQRPKTQHLSRPHLFSLTL